LLDPIEIVTNGFGSIAVGTNIIAVTGPKGSRISLVEDAAATASPWVATLQGINGISPDGRWLGIYASYTPLLYIYRLPEMQQVATLTNLANVSDFTFSPAGNEVAVSSRNGVELWNVGSWDRTRLLTNFNNLVYSPEGYTCWLSQEYRSSALYQAASLEPLLPLPAGALPLGGRDVLGANVAVYRQCVLTRNNTTC
jgi:hypothetical protein